MAFIRLRRKIYASGRSHMAGYRFVHEASVSPLEEANASNQAKQFSAVPKFGSVFAHVLISPEVITTESWKIHVSSVAASEPPTKYIVPSGTPKAELTKLERADISVRILVHFIKC